MHNRSSGEPRDNALRARAAARAKTLLLPHYLIAFLATALGVCVGLLANPLLDDGGPLLTPVLVFLIAVMLAARYGGRDCWLSR